MPDMISGMAYKAAMYALELPNVLIAQMTVRVAHGRRRSQGRLVGELHRIHNHEERHDVQVYPAANPAIVFFRDLTLISGDEFCCIVDFMEKHEMSFQTILPGCAELRGVFFRLNRPQWRQ